jgi:hypothetical protein
MSITHSDGVAADRFCTMCKVKKLHPKEGAKVCHRCANLKRQEENPERYTCPVEECQAPVFVYGICRQHAKWHKKYDLGLEAMSALNKIKECQICEREPTNQRSSLVIDHNHIAGEVRERICHDCNVGLGMFGDLPDLLLNVKSYLLSPPANLVKSSDFSFQLLNDQLSIEDACVCGLRKRKRVRSPYCNTCLLRFKRLGIHPKHIAAIRSHQSAKCGICQGENHQRHQFLDGIQDADLHLDHCHSSGLIRGFLCSKCNTGLGRLQDNLELIAKAIIYPDNGDLNEFN